ncbi:5568_t:CDS:10 [Paraglomus occultum]|uniref:5568_t:CDS:1 n=1 Tax=Paraglomus occultum TaxID=144539 RepID=A0A9N8WDN2_9GLOM|nr:5568_t:CDS:10 [Paraglomus occultum]
MTKRKEQHYEVQVTDENDVLKITALGAGNEVGRSCVVIQYKGKTVMLDAGVHPAYNGIEALPYFEQIDPSTVDILLISQYVIWGIIIVDYHAASLPYFTEMTTFQGRVFMTHPTKAIYKWLLSDYVRVSNVSVSNNLYNEENLIRSYEKIDAIDYHQEVEVEGIKFTSYNAGHVLGAAMFLIEIAGVKHILDALSHSLPKLDPLPTPSKILYTGDYSREEDRHLMAAEVPPVQPDVLITESTYGVQSYQPRLEKESRFTNLVHSITYINMMNARIRKQFAVSNPFVFKHISNLKNMDNFDDVGPCVMMASPGMLQSGLSRELFERWAPDRRNGLVITGYCVDGTLARHAMTEPSDIPSMSGAKIPLRMSVDSISFSAHVDYTQNSQFIDEVKAPHVVLVHGETNAMGRLKSALKSKYAEREENINIYTPKNCEIVKLHFRGEKMAKTIGTLASKYPTENQIVTGILVSKDFQFNIISASDLKEFSGIATSSILQKQTIGYRASFSLLRYHLEQMFGVLEEIVDNDEVVGLKILGVLSLTHTSAKYVTLEWLGNSINDVIADSVLTVILNIESSPASVKVTKPPHHSHSHTTTSEDILNDAERFLKQQFGEVRRKPDSNDEVLIVSIDEHTAEVNVKTMDVNYGVKPIIINQFVSGHGIGDSDRP